METYYTSIEPVDIFPSPSQRPPDTGEDVEPARGFGRFYTRRHYNIRLKAKTVGGGLMGVMALFLAGLLSVTWPPSVSRAADPELTIEVVPTSVSLLLEGEAFAQIVVRNPTTYTLKNLTLSTFTNFGVSAVISEENTLASLTPNERHIWTLKFSKKKDDPVTGSVQIRVDFTRDNQDPILLAERSVFASIDVTDRPTIPVDEIADVRLETSLTSINEYNPGKIYLIVSNKSNSNISVTKIAPHQTDYMAFTPDSITTPVSLAPRESYVALFSVVATNSVKTGKYLLVFEANVSWGQGNTDQRATLVATHQVAVGVFGESEILAPLAVPSFFVLPGFLMVTLWLLLWGIFKPRGKTLDLKALSSEFWLIAITLSLAMALWIYPFVTGKLSVVPRNYLNTYGFSDIAIVWALSLLISLLGYFLLVGGGLLIIRWLEHRKRQKLLAHTFAIGDPPLSTLRKLAKRGRNNYLERTQYTVNEQDYPAFLLDKYNPAQSKHWIAPSIVITGLGSASTDVRTEIDKQKGEMGSSAALADIIEKTEGLGLAWQPKGPLTAPLEVDTTKISAPTLRNVIVE